MNSKVSKKRKTINATNWKSQPGFKAEDWPPTTVADWAKEYNMRIQPEVSSLCYHHYLDLSSIIIHFVRTGGNKVQKEVERQLGLMLPKGITPSMVNAYKKINEKKKDKPLEMLYFLTLVVDIKKIRYVHPMVTYRIILRLIENEEFVDITNHTVRTYIKCITSTGSDVREAIRNNYN